MLTNEEVVKIVNHRLSEIDYPSKISGTEAVSELGGGPHITNKNVLLEDGRELVFRWTPFKIQYEDDCFGGRKSIQRDAKILNLLYSAGLPASQVIDYHEDESEGKILLVQKMPGITLHALQERNNHSLNAFLDIVRSLGFTLARTHNIHFKSFGSVQPEGIVPSLNNYGSYLEQILKRHFGYPYQILQHYYSDEEISEIVDYFIETIEQLQSINNIAASLVLYDQHDTNFFINPQDGQISGIFDVEFGQAAIPVLEMASVSLQILSYYPNHFQEAYESFMEGYTKAGNPELIDIDSFETIHTLHVANHLLSAVKSYHDRKDGIRDRWSKAFAQMTLDIVYQGKVTCYRDFTLLINQDRKRRLEPRSL